MYKIFHIVKVALTVSLWLYSYCTPATRTLSTPIEPPVSELCEFRSPWSYCSEALNSLIKIILAANHQTFPGRSKTELSKNFADLF